MTTMSTPGPGVTMVVADVTRKRAKSVAFMTESPNESAQETLQIGTFMSRLALAGRHGKAGGAAREKRIERQSRTSEHGTAARTRRGFRQQKSPHKPKAAGAKMASLILGTADTPVWLLRSRPDQVSGDRMRGDPPSPQLYVRCVDFAKNFSRHRALRCKNSFQSTCRHALLRL